MIALAKQTDAKRPPRTQSRWGVRWDRPPGYAASAVELAQDERLPTATVERAARLAGVTRASGWTREDRRAVRRVLRLGVARGGRWAWGGSADAATGQVELGSASPQTARLVCDATIERQCADPDERRHARRLDVQDQDERHIPRVGESRRGKWGAAL